MTQNPSTNKEKVRLFWDRYLKTLYESSVRPPADRWMTNRAVQYVEADSERKLADKIPDNVDGCLAELRRQPGLQDWQFRQADAAIQNLSSLAGANWLVQRCESPNTPL